jgi:hypothetical protein
MSISTYKNLGFWSKTENKSINVNDIICIEKEPKILPKLSQNYPLHVSYDKKTNKYMVVLNDTELYYSLKNKNVINCIVETAEKTPPPYYKTKDEKFKDNHEYIIHRIFTNLKNKINNDAEGTLIYGLAYKASYKDDIVHVDLFINGPNDFHEDLQFNMKRKIPQTYKSVGTDKIVKIYSCENNENKKNKDKTRLYEFEYFIGVTGKICCNYLEFAKLLQDEIKFYICGKD